ncbi:MULTISPECIES: FAD-dependent monooxygenase [Roseateles]|uniref:2-polyprenyl-6-methoxyphenol hydroxylase-like FAD-dependent oxidoreductase n=1 Tax=Pelomonas aquatica TaxID=431058 RepID=A0ABU1Z5X5_9BURK|nr:MULTISPECIES: FAD-dependent monooxygenase [Roseateles]KQY82800.1 2-octaprenyl-3-methyl-6-methoxy-1,4-benzoquinol hydroxylase [Pelomonas sp. Root1444]MDR7295838.1 2-polyprenyl-6-methoxyphenol hydroxylase-like FAD-dependent oxidoreductase [Pelomonas aquatica]
MQSVDVLVRGRGAVGSSLALSLAAQGLSVGMTGAAEAARPDDVRTYALNAASVALLTELKIWGSLPADAVSPVYDMVVCGDASSEQPAGRLSFSAWQQGLGELAVIVDAAALDAQLATALRFSPHVHGVPDQTPAALTALCEGRESAARAALGVGFTTKPYGHRALAARLTADRSHQGVARQWFQPGGEVLALLPFERPAPGASYGLVWSCAEARAEQLQALPTEDFERELNAATGAAAGALKLASERSSWPLAVARADAVSGAGWVLLGDAAHIVHPLAGQGLNLGLGDVAALSRVLAQREPWRPLGDERLLRRYARERLAPTLAMGELTDVLQRLFAHGSPAAQGLRNRGMDALNQLTPVKRWLTQRALGL